MKANFITFVRGLKNGTSPQFQSYLKSLTLLLVMLMSVNMWGAIVGIPVTWAGSTMSVTTGAGTATISNSKNGTAHNQGNMAASNNDYWLFTIPVKNIESGTTITITLSGVKNNKDASKGTYTFKYSKDNSSYTAFGDTYPETTTATSVTRSFKLSSSISAGTLYIKMQMTSGGATNAGNHYLGDVSVTAEAGSIIPATITLSVAGTETPISGYNVGDKYTLPSKTDATCGDKTFVGWSTTEEIVVDNLYEPGEEVTLAANNIFYAVFADEEEGDASTTFTFNGEILGTGGYKDADFEWGGIDFKRSQMYYNNSGAQIKASNYGFWNQEAFPGAIKQIKVTATQNDATLYVGASAKATTSSNSISKGAERTIDFSTSNNYKYLYIKSGNSYTVITTLTVTYVGITYSNYTTTCAAPRDIDHIEVTGTPATFWKGDEFNHTGMTVKAYYTEGDPDDVTGSATYSGYDMSVAGEQTVTVTYKEKTATYTINVKTIANTAETAYTTAKAIEIIDAGKDLATQVYVKGTVSSIVTAFSESFGNISFNVSDDGETTSDQFQFYRNFKGADKAKWTSADEAPQVGDEVIGYGTLAKHSSTYEFAEGNYIVSLNRPKKLTSITVSGTPAYFDTQSSFNHNGMTVTAHYNTGAGDDANVTENENTKYIAPDMTVEGDHKEVKVSYTEGDITVNASYYIDIKKHCDKVVEITKGDEENGTFSLSQTGNICADGGLTISVTDIVPAEHYHFKQITATNGDVDDNAKTVSNITANTTINVEFEEDEKVTVKWYIGTAAPVETTDVYVGTAFADVKANAPTVADNAAGDCANKFMGWATSAITAQDGVAENAVAWATEPISNENKDFYAVWAKATGSTSSDPAVTFDFTDAGWGFPTDAKKNEAGIYTNGDYSITISASTDGHKKGTIQVSGGVYQQVSILFGKQNTTLTLPDFGFPISKIVTGGVSGGSTSVKFNIYSEDDAASTEVTNCTTDHTFEIADTYQSSELAIKVCSSHNLQIGSLKVYAGASYSNYITSCFVPTYSVTIQSNNTTMGTAAINPEHIKDAYEQGDDLEVNATVTDGTIYRFVNWTIEPATTGASLYMGANEAENLLTVGSGNITLTANFEAIPADPITVTLEVGEHGTLDCDDCEGNQLTEGTAGEGVLVPNVNANEGWVFLGWSTTEDATEAEFDPANADIFTPSETNNILYAVYAQLYKVTLKYTDEVLWQETVGGSVTLSSRNCKNATYKDHFVGWSTTEFAEETTNPATAPTIYAENITPTEDVVLYPVFSVSAEETQWKKMTTASLSESGIYAMIGNDDKAYNGSISDGHGQSTEASFAFDANGIATTAPEGTCELTFTALGDGHFTIYQQGKGYLYGKAASSGNLAWHETESYYWMWYSKGSQWEYVNNNVYVYLRYNNSNFRTYGNNTGELIALAKKETASVGKYWSKPANDVINPELDLAAGDYLAPQTIKITDDTYQSGYKYYYTTNGNDPDKTSAEYDHENGIKLETADNYTVKVIGYDEDNYETQVAEETYALYPVFNSISDMYAGATNDKPVGLVLTNAYVHAVNTIGVNSQIFVQQDNLGVVLSTTTVPEGVVAGKQISGTATGKYTINNGRPQISQFAFQSTFSVNEGPRPEPTTITQTTADLVSTNLLGLVKLEGVYAQSDASNIIVVTEKTDGTGKSSNVYDFFNKVSTIPASDVKCNVIGLFNERKGEKDPEIVYSIMPILDNDFDVVEKQNATLPTVSPLGSTVEAEPTKVASGESVTITPAAGFTTSYTVNGGEKQTISASSAQIKITEDNTTIVVEATRPYYNAASATYYYEIDPGLTKYHITLPSVQTYYKIVSDVTDQKAGETITLTISNITEHWNITGVTVEKADDEATKVEVANPETNIYTFVMPAYAVNVKVDYESDPTYKIDYLKGDDVTGVTGDDIKESKQYAGTELTLKECTWKAAGYSFVGWKAYYIGEDKQEVPITITDNKIIVPAHDVKIKAMWDEAAWHKEGTWELVTKTTELGVGDYVIFTETVNAGTESDRYAGTSTVNTAGRNFKTTTNISIEGNKLTRTNNDATMIFQIEEGNETNTFAFYADGIGYLNANGTGDQNYMITTESKASVNASWAVESIDATTGEASVRAKSSNRNLMQTNGNLFAAYGSKQKGLAIYKFYPKAWTVTFDDNVEDEEIEVPKMQRADHITNKVTISEMVPERTGYTFSKWNSAKGGKGTISAEPGDEIELSRNTTLYAQWVVNQYNVAVEQVDNITIKAKPYGDAEIIEGANADVNFKKSVVLTYTDLDDAYVFKSWKVTKAGDESVIVPLSVGSSTTFEVPAYAVTVSAIIESKATTQLTVTYHANGGKNKTAEGPEEVSEEVKYNTTLTFTAENCPFEKKLCTFVGWNTKADGTGTTYKTQKTITSDMDLYAMWQASAVEYVIDKDAEGNVYVKDGAAPEDDATAAYNQDNSNFGQMTANNPEGTLTLTGFAGKVITDVKMQMHSNKNGGAGTIVVKVGDKEICSTSYAESFGSHSTSYSVAELQNFNAAIVGENENITIVVTASDNSLYINGYIVEYETPQTTTIRGNLTPDQYTTYCERQTVLAGTYTGATFWNIAEKAYMSDGIRLYSITIEQHTGDLEAGVPYIMLPTATELKGVKYGEEVNTPVAEGNNGLYGTFVNYAFDENEAEARDAQQLYIISDGTLYLCGTGCGVYAYRAYIKSDQINYVAPTGAPRRTIGAPRGTATGLFNNVLRGNDDVMKVIRNNQLYIIKNGRTYNAQGAWLK